MEIQLFGALRDLDPRARMQFDTDASTIGELRVQLQSLIDGPERVRALVTRSAFASSTSVLRDSDALPDDGQLALLPPVSGG